MYSLWAAPIAAPTTNERAVFELHPKRVNNELITQGRPGQGVRLQTSYRYAYAIDNFGLEGSVTLSSRTYSSSNFFLSGSLRSDTW